MKKIYFILFKFNLLVTLISYTNSNAQTTLVAGDIAFTGYNADGADSFSFLLLKDITSGTIINFTDNGWISSTSSLRNGEGTCIWTAQTDLPTGTEVLIVADATPFTTTRLPNGNSGTAGTVSYETASTVNLAASGDQILAYQGTSSSPTFISGIHCNAENGAILTTDLVWDDTNTDSSNRSSLPPGLTSGVNAIWAITGTPGSAVEIDNVKFNCGSFDLSTVVNIKTVVYDKLNWVYDDLNPNTLPTACNYTLSIEDFNLENKVMIYPNPFTNNIDIETTIAVDFVQIFDVLGKPIYSEAFTNKIDTASLNTGVYLLRLRSRNGQVIMRKIVKK